jgi:hypothetical protein
MLATGRTSKIFDVETLGLELMRPSKKGPLRFGKNQKSKKHKPESHLAPRLFEMEKSRYRF